MDNNRQTQPFAAGFSGRALTGGALTDLFSEAEEVELAYELMEARSDAELDQFLGDLFKKATRAVGRALKSPVARQLGGVLKSVAKVALPLAGTAVGTYFGGPLGGQIGGFVGSTTGKILGLEIPGLSEEEQEFEVARRFVRLAGDAVKEAVQAPPSAAPEGVARSAVATAAQKYAPGLLTAQGQALIAGSVPSAHTRSGRWVRQGNQVVLFGA